MAQNPSDEQPTNVITDNPLNEINQEEEEEMTGSTLTTYEPIIIDNGGGLIKTGMAGSDNPYCVPSLVGLPKHRRVMLQSPSTSKYFGNLALKHRGLCKLSHPVNRGLITNWNDMIQLWQYLYSDILEINENNVSEHPVLITEPANNPIANKIRISQIYLEYFNVPSIYFAPPPILALYTTGRLTGCVLDSGHGLTSSVPIIDGYSFNHGITRHDLAGYDVTKYFSSILSQCGDYKFETSAELETVRIIKEKECVLDDFGVDFMLNQSYHSTGLIQNGIDDIHLKAKLHALGTVGSSLAAHTIGSKSSSDLNRGSSNSTKQLLPNNDPNSPSFRLPDGMILNIGNTHKRAAEILFDPSIIGNNKSRGIHYCILDSISKCDANLRNKLYSNIYLTGGNCNIQNFKNRLLNELKRKAPNKKIKIFQENLENKNKKHLIPFIGASLITQQSGFKDIWITKEEFNEYGTNILYRKSLC